jgi:hypothetical protein
VVELVDAANMEAYVDEGGAPSEISPGSSELEPRKPTSLLPSPPRPAGGEEVEVKARSTRGTEPDPAESPSFRSRGEPALSLFKGSGQEIQRSSPGHHAHATSKTSETRPSPPLGDADGNPPGELAPNTKSKKKTRLQAIQRGRTPLSPSIGPAKPPEEGERAVGRRPTTVKEGRERRAVIIRLTPQLWPSSSSVVIFAIFLMISSISTNLMNFSLLGTCFIQRVIVDDELVNYISTEVLEYTLEQEPNREGNAN